jgi:hypothetical protein
MIVGRWLVVAEDGRLVKNHDGRVREQGRGGKSGRRNCITNVWGDQEHSVKRRNEHFQGDLKRI